MDRVIDPGEFARMFEFDASRERDDDPPAGARRSWAMFSVHGHVLITIARDPDAQVAQIAQRLKMTETGVRRVVSDLIASRLVAQVQIGRRTRFEITSSDPMITGQTSPRSTAAVTRLYGETA